MASFEQIGASRDAVCDRGAVAAPAQRQRQAANFHYAGRLPDLSAAMAEHRCRAGNGGGAGGGEGRQNPQSRLPLLPILSVFTCQPHGHVGLSIGTLKHSVCHTQYRL
jgi:hypothetical protein